MIEFAVCMPVLIILLFYINDLVRIKRYYSQTEFVAQQMANMIQNISQKREDKTITLNDLKYIYVLGFKSIFPGNTIFYTTKNHELGYQATYYVHYFVGSSDGTATRKWSARLYSDNVATPKTILCNSTMLYSKSPWPTKLNPGEVKIVVEAAFCNSPNQKNASGASTAKEVFQLRLISPKEVGYNSTNSWSSYFNSAVTFTPKPGLFTDTIPK